MKTPGNLNALKNNCHQGGPMWRSKLPNMQITLFLLKRRFAKFMEDKSINSW